MDLEEFNSKYWLVSKTIASLEELLAVHEIELGRLNAVAHMKNYTQDDKGLWKVKDAVL